MVAIAAANIEVLLLENDASHAEAILRALQSSNAHFVVRVACSLREYHDRVAAYPPDIALLNMDMPDGCSLDLVYSPPEANPFPILIMANFGDEKTAVEAMKAGALDYVVKSPQAFAVMPRILSRAMERWQLLRERKLADEARRASEQDFRLLAAYHKRLNDISISFMEATNTDDLFNRIAETFRFLAGAIASSFSVYNQGTRDLKVVSLSIDPISRDKVSSIFGPGLFEMRMPVGADDLEHMLSHGIRRPKDLCELSFGVISRDLSDALMDAAGCVQIVALAISYAAELTGTCVAYLPGDHPMVPDDALRTFAYLSGLAVKRRWMEEALLESEAQYRLLSEHTTDFVWLLDMNLKPTYQSASAEKLTGFTQQEIRELPFNKRVAPESLKLASAVFLEELPRVEMDPDYNPVRILDLEYYCKDGTTAWAENRFSIIRDQNGKAVSILGEARDITERRCAEKDLRESEGKYRLVVENAMEAIVIEVDGTVKFANRRTMDLTGYSIEELTTRPFIEFIHPDDRQMVVERYIRWLNGEAVPTTDTVRFIFKHGDIKWGELSVVSITWEGRPATLGFLTDVTDRKRLEEERQRVEKLESVGLLAGGIAHDFNNILTSILGNISLAGIEAAPGSELKNSLEQAEKASLRAKDLTVQLLTFAKGGAPVMKLASLTELLKDTAGFALHGSNVKCHFSIPADLCHAEIDAGQVSQVIQNLVINAQQAMPAGGTIELRAENIALSETQSLGRGLPIRAGNYIRIAVTDYGSGISRDHLVKIFDPFFTTKRKGSGLGLATSFSIARNHGGHLSVESELGSGSTFYLYLPASLETSATKQDKKEQVKPEGMARILVMDDEQGVREVAGRMLKHLGYQDVEFATDGAEAIKLYEAAMEAGHPFTVAILDLTIPGGVGGKETVRKLLKIDPGVKAIVSSGYIDDSVIAKYWDYGFCGMVAKPYTLEQLRKALQDVTGWDP